jgi:cation diffusion facilitator family transporter
MNKSTKVAFFTLIVSVVVLILKTKAYYATHSIAVLSDALETVVNVITALVALFAVKAAAEPADENHPYGHGKFEYFSAAFEGGLIFFAALAIIYQAIHSFIGEHELIHPTNGNFYLIAATAINLLTSLFLMNFGKSQRSEALKASGKHILSDVATSVGVIAGLYLVKWTGILWIDSVMALVLGFWLMFEAYKILRTNSGALLDEVDTVALAQLAEVINKHKIPAVIDIHNVRMIRSGNFHHIDAHMVVPEFWDVKHVHSVTHEFEKSVVHDYLYDGEVAFHIDPCKQSFCRQCNVENCHIRKMNFEAVVQMDYDHLIKGPQYTN